MSVQTLALPRLGETMETGRVAGWLKRPGDTFKRGETIVEIESDKTVVELPALADGTLVEILAAEGSDIDVGAPLCTFEGVGAVAAAEQAPSEQAVETSPAVEERPLAKEAPVPVATEPPARDSAGERTRATPVARRLARENGVSLDGLRGHGRRGRIEAADVRAAVRAPSEGDPASVWEPSGPVRGTVLAVHGFGGDAQTWAGLAAALTRKGWRVVAPDLPGHGTSERDAQDVAGLVDALAAFAASVEGEFELVGHSLGAAVAVGVARVFPAAVRRLTLIAPAGLGTEIDAEFVSGMADAQAPGTLSHLLRRLSVRPPAITAGRLSEMAASLGTGRLRAIASAIVANGRQTVDIAPDLASLPMPTRIVWGLDDRIIPWRHVLQAPSRTALHLVANAGHMPHWDQPQEVAALFD